MDYIDKFNEIVDKMEPMPDFEMEDDDMESLRTNSIVSIAVSLKRIADILTTVYSDGYPDEKS